MSVPVKPPVIPCGLANSINIMLQSFWTPIGKYVLPELYALERYGIYFEQVDDKPHVITGITSKGLT